MSILLTFRSGLRHSNYIDTQIGANQMFSVILFIAFFVLYSALFSEPSQPVIVTEVVTEVVSDGLGIEADLEIELDVDYDEYLQSLGVRFLRKKCTDLGYKGAGHWNKQKCVDALLDHE